MSKNGYQVITCCDDSGADDKLEYGSIRTAEKAAQRYVEGFEFNTMCDYCSLLGRECKRTTEKVCTGCVYRQFTC